MKIISTNHQQQKMGLKLELPEYLVGYILTPCACRLLREQLKEPLTTEFTGILAQALKQLQLRPSTLQVRQNSVTVPDEPKLRLREEMVRGWQSCRPVKQSSLEVQAALGLKKQTWLMQIWLSTRSTKLELMVSWRYLRDLRLEILRNLIRSQQKKSILQAGQPWNLLILILMALAQMPVKQMVVMLTEMLEGTWKGFCTRTKLVPSTEYSRKNSVMQLPLTDSSCTAQKVKGASLIDSPMNWEESAVAALHPFPDDSLRVVREQSWNEASKEELKKNLPSSDPGDRLLMQYLDCLTSIGVMEKLQLSLDPMRLRSCCLQAKHSPFLRVQPTLQTVQLEPLYCAHPAVQGKQIELKRKNLSEHLEHTPLVYSMHLPSCFSHWKKAFRKKPAAQDRHFSLSLSQV